MEVRLSERIKGVERKLHRTFLIIEKSQRDAFVVRRLLERSGVADRAAGCGAGETAGARTSGVGASGMILHTASIAEAFSLIAAVHIDAVLLNVHLDCQDAGEHAAVTDALNLLTRLRQVAMDRPAFILMMNPSHALNIADFYQAGAKGHLVKPSTPEELRVVLEHILK